MRLDYREKNVARCDYCGRYISMSDYRIICSGSINGLEPEYDTVCLKCDKEEKSSK